MAVRTMRLSFAAADFSAINGAPAARIATRFRPTSATCALGFESRYGFTLRNADLTASVFTHFKDAEIGSVNKKDLMSQWAFQA